MNNVTKQEVRIKRLLFDYAGAAWNSLEKRNFNWLQTILASQLSGRAPQFVKIIPVIFSCQFLAMTILSNDCFRKRAADLHQPSDPGVSKLRPAGQIRPAEPFHLASENILAIMKKYYSHEKFVDLL